MNGADALMRTLVDNGVTACFANPGTSEMHFVAALDNVERQNVRTDRAECERQRAGFTHGRGERGVFGLEVERECHGHSFFARAMLARD